LRHALLSVFAVAVWAASASALDVPYLSGRVNDAARLFDAQTTRGLELELKDYEARTGRQFAVLTIPSLEGEPLEEYALKVARTWRLGTKGRDDGVLLLVVRDDHRIRIEVGYGLEGKLPDALCGRIIRDRMVPRFRAGDFAGGTAAAVDALIADLGGSYVPPTQNPLHGRGGVDPAEMPLSGKVLVSALLLAVLVPLEGFGLIEPDVGWLIFFFLIPFWGAFALAIWGAAVSTLLLGAHLIVFPILKRAIARTEWGRRRAEKIAAYKIRCRSYSSGAGGWSSGGGGGFSGGGGSFGGGGASGSW
jgi:uncharacterized protein